ncbi:MAG: helix-hairpin-helix domain-containing protein [Bacteroidetes bacterium]|nr:helix-hairpin-helix domain-containing protein [Bacteroidota bacterium]
MTNKEIARPLKETAALIELTGGNPFRARALDNAARIIERLETAVPELISTGELANIKGIGAGLVAQIEEILAYGSFELRDDILGGLPPGLLDVLSVKGLGAKKARTLWQSLGIQSLDDLEAAALAGRIAELDGFAEKSQQTILENIGSIRSYQGKRRIADAWVDALRLKALLQAHPAVKQAIFAGEISRLMEVVETISIVVISDLGRAVDICQHLNLNFEISSGPDKIRATASLSDGLLVEIIFVEEAKAGRVLFEAIGPKSFVDSFGLEDGAPHFRSEAEIFNSKKVPYLAPELRDLPSAFDRAETLSKLSLLEYAELHGIIHNHSTYSDGAHSLREMSLAVRNGGFGYFGICDHSQSLKIASGMSIATVHKQKAEVGRLNTEFASDGGAPFRVFFGVESDILTDGRLDYPDDVLAAFDFIVASVHIGFKMSEKEATERIIKAISNPYTTVLGHPTGRLILKREGYPINHQAVLEACAYYGVAVELNANPYRLDLDWRWIETATALGVLVSINPDAHSVDQLDLMKWGALVARKGGLTASQCLNALTAPQFDAFLQAKRKASGIA